MGRALFLDDDVSFVIKAQKLLPKDTEWLATTDMDKAEALFQSLDFDAVIVRKQNQDILSDFVARMIGCSTGKELRPFKKLIVLPHFFWQLHLRRKIGDRS